MNSSTSETDRLKEVANYFAKIDNKLQITLSRPDSVGGKGRRQFIEHVCSIASLCVAAQLIGEKGREEIEIFDMRLRKNYGERLWEFGEVQVQVHRLTIEGWVLTPAEEMWWLMELVRAVWKFDWEDWRTVRDVLITMLLYDDTCAG